MRKIIFIVLFVILAGFFYLSRPLPESNKVFYGVTFSQIFSKQLGLDWQENFLAILDDLKVRKLRLIAYWPEIELKSGKYYFFDIDWQIEEAEKRNAEIILAVGQKLPRWPECHIPEWAKNLSQEKQEESLLNFMRKIIERYKDKKTVKIWQVENEPFLSFGECPKLDKEFLNKEINFVRSLDSSRPVLLTDSGELGLWVNAAKGGDIFGTTMYFQIYHKLFGQFRWPIFPGFFRLKQRVTDLLVGAKPKIVIEFQMEPWGEKQLYELTLEKQLEIFNADQFDSRIKFVKKTGFNTVYFWGAEWWFWLKAKHQKPEFWEKARTLYSY